MITKIIQNGLVSATSNPPSMESSGLIMTLTQHYALDERLERSVIGELVFDLRLENIEKIFHLPPSDYFYSITYESVDRCY